MYNNAKHTDEKHHDKPSEIAFFVTWRIRNKNRNKDFMATFDDHRDAATFIVKNKKSKPDMQVFMAIREHKPWG